MNRQEGLEKFAQALVGDERRFPWPWERTASHVIKMRRRATEGFGIYKEAQTSPAALEAGSQGKDDIIQGLVNVHQEQQATVAAAEAESRAIRGELDQARKGLLNIQQQLQQQQAQQAQMQQQFQMQTQQAQMQTQQAQMKAQQIEAMAGPQVQQAEQVAAAAKQTELQAKIELAQERQRTAGIQQAILEYKNKIQQVLAQDPVTLSEVNRQQQEQAIAQQQSVQIQQQALAQEQQGQQGQQGPPQEGQPQEQGQGGPPPQGQPQGQPNPMEALSKLVAGGGERGRMRQELARQHMTQAAQQGAQQGQGGMQIPEGSLAAGMLQQQQ